MVTKRRTLCRWHCQKEFPDENLNDDRHLGYLLVRMSLHDGNLKQCEQILNSLEAKYRESGLTDVDLGVHVAASRAALLRLRHQPEEAVKLLRNSLNHIAQLPRSDIEQINLRLQLALLLGEQCKLEEAIKVVEAARSSCSERGYRELGARASSLLGGLKLLMGMASEAYDLLSEAAQRYEISDSTLYLGFGEIVREGNIFADPLLLLPASAVAAGRPREAISHMLRLKADVTV